MKWTKDVLFLFPHKTVILYFINDNKFITKPAKQINLRIFLFPFSFLRIRAVRLIKKNFD